MEKPKSLQEVLQLFDEQVKNKIVDHAFNGSCLYNNNENGKGHLECRFPFNPGNEKSNEAQCLKLQEEHFNFKQFISDSLTDLLSELRMEERKYVSPTGYNHGSCCNCSECKFDHDSCECERNKLVREFNTRIDTLLNPLTNNKE